MDKNKMVKITIKTEVIIDEDALNSAGWVFNDEWNKLLAEYPDIVKRIAHLKSGWLFNNIKRIIRPVIQKYLEELIKDEPK